MTDREQDRESPTKCPICGDEYSRSLSGTVGDGQPLDTRSYARLCFEYEDDGSVYNYIHEQNRELDWSGDLLEFADQSDRGGG